MMRFGILITLLLFACKVVAQRIRPDAITVYYSGPRSEGVSTGIELDTIHKQYRFALTASYHDDVSWCAQLISIPFMSGHYHFSGDTLVLQRAMDSFEMRFVEKGNLLKSVIGFSFLQKGLTKEKYRKAPPCLVTPYNTFSFKDSLHLHSPPKKLEHSYQNVCVDMNTTQDAVVLTVNDELYKVSINTMVLSEGSIEYDNAAKNYVMHDSTLQYNFRFYLDADNNIHLIDYPLAYCNILYAASYIEQELALIKEYREQQRREKKNRKDEPVH